MTIHDLKTWPEFYRPMIAGLQRFDVREATDRTFTVSDLVLFREWNPIPADGCRADLGDYTGRQFLAQIEFVLDKAPALPMTLVVFGFRPIGTDNIGEPIAPDGILESVVDRETIEAVEAKVQEVADQVDREILDGVPASAPFRKTRHVGPRLTNEEIRTIAERFPCVSCDEMTPVLCRACASADRDSAEESAHKARIERLQLEQAIDRTLNDHGAAYDSFNVKDRVRCVCIDWKNAEATAKRLTKQRDEIIAERDQGLNRLAQFISHKPTCNLVRCGHESKMCIIPLNDPRCDCGLNETTNAPGVGVIMPQPRIERVEDNANRR